MSSTVLVMGTLCIDLLPAFDHEPRLVPGALLDVGRLAMQPGGCVGNTGLALQELGTSTLLAADVGDDALGQAVLAQLRSRGGDVSHVRAVRGQSTSYSIVVGQSGDRCIWHHPGANDGFTGAECDDVPADIAHLGYPSLLGRIAAADGERLREMLGRRRAAATTTSLDLAFVDRARSSPIASWIEWFQAVLPLVDVLEPSLDDLASVGLTGASLRDVADRLLAMGPAVVVVKDSVRGMIMVTGDAARLRSAGGAFRDQADVWAEQALWMPAFSVSTTSTNGAGDAAVAGLLHGIASGLGPAGSLCCAAATAAARVEGGGVVPGWGMLEQRIAAGWPVRSATPPSGVEAVTISDVIRSRADRADPSR